MNSTASLLLSVLMIAGFVLAGAGIYRWRKFGDRQRGVLMIVAALVMWGNVAVWVV